MSLESETVMARQPDPPARFRLCNLEAEITPEPTDDERAAILAALADEPQPPLPEDDDP